LEILKNYNESARAMRKRLGGAEFPQSRFQPERPGGH
jgi:hypothetical protein